MKVIAQFTTEFPPGSLEIALSKLFTKPLALSMIELDFFSADFTILLAESHALFLMSFALSSACFCSNITTFFLCFFY